MKKILKKITLVGAVTIIPVLALACGLFEAGDKVMVKKAIQMHFKGVATGDALLLEQAWDAASARLQYVVVDDEGKSSIVVDSAREAFKSWTSKPDTAARGEVLSVDVVDGQMAMAKVKFNWKGQTFTDFLTLLNKDGSWKIVNKTFTGSGKRLVKERKSFVYGA